MSERYHQALVAAGIDVTYQVHPGAHDIPDFLDEINAMLKWGLFKPVVTEPAVLGRTQTVATSGQLWDFNYRFANPPTQIVTFRQSGTTLVDQRRRIRRHDHYGHRMCHPHLHAGDRAPARPQPDLPPLSRQSGPEGMSVSAAEFPLNRERRSGTEV